MRIFTCEYATMTGWAPLLREGAAMLRALALDFLAAGEDVLLPAVAAPHVFPEGLPAEASPSPGFEAGVRASDAVLLIAPEFGGILENLTRRAEDLGGHLLGTGSGTLALAADKWSTLRRWYAAGLPVPRSALLVEPGAAPVRLDDPVGERERLVDRAAGWVVDGTADPAAEGTPPHLPFPPAEFPLIVKPRRGAGCAALQVVGRAARWRSAIGAAWAEAAEIGETHLIVQERLRGRPVSVSLVATPTGILPLCVNDQHLEHRAGRLTYRGGASPLLHPQAAEAARLAADACRLLPGLRGWVGVDLLLTADGPVLLEVNARLTTAYLGVRQVLETNPALHLLGELRRTPPPLPSLSGRTARFTTEDFPGPRPAGD